MVARVAALIVSALLVLGISAALAGCTSEPAPSSVAACPLDSITGVLEPLGPPGSIGIAVDSQHLIVVWGDGHRSLESMGPCRLSRRPVRSSRGSATESG